MMFAQQQQGQPALAIVAHGAQNLKDVETFGKQDPYVRFSVDISNTKSFQKSYVHKDAGKTPTWNQSFTIPLAGEPELFVEIMDEETTADAVIAFCAIPINQVVHAPGGVFNGIFDVYTVDGKAQGEINLTLTAHNVPGQNTGFAQPGQPVKGTSHISELHQKRMKSLANKEKAADIGGIAAGGLLAIGAGLLVNKLVNDNNREEEAKKEAERAAAAEHERFETEKKQLEAQRLQFEQQQHLAQQQQQQQQQGQGHAEQPHYQQGRDEYHQGGHYDKHKKDKKKKHHGSGSDSDSSDSDSGSDSDSDKKKKGKKWEGHGRWYSPGDKVKYDGHKYVCLQGHNSQPDWTPSAAHSLFRRD